MRPDRVYVDETKAKGFVLVAATLAGVDCDRIRRDIRGLVAPGQSRLHMKAERTSRQHLIVSTLVRLELRAVVYRADSAHHRTDIDRRRACVTQLVTDIAGSCDRLVLESDTSQDPRDRQQLIELSRRLTPGTMPHYEHRTAAAEPLLAIPDAIAWAWARGGDWRRRVGPVITAVVEV